MQLDRYVLHELSLTETVIRDGYDHFAFSKGASSLS
jgi:hypothetical protein